MWQRLIFDWAKSENKYTVSFNELYESPICQNATINRRLKLDAIKQIAEWMIQKQFAEYTTGA